MFTKKKPLSKKRGYEILKLFFVEGGGHVAHVVLSGLAREGHDPVFHRERVGHLAKREPLFFGSGLHMDVAKVEDSGNNAIDCCGHILNAGKPELADTAIEETFLFDIDDSFVRYYPDIKIVVDPDEKTKEPQKKEEGVLNKAEEEGVISSSCCRKERRKKGNAT